MYIEKDVADNIDSEKLSYHTTILKYENLWKKILKLYVFWVCFYFVMLIYSSFIINNFFKN